MTASDYVNFIIAMAAPSPKHAAEMVRQIRAMISVRDDHHVTTVGQKLEAIVFAVSNEDASKPEDVPSEIRIWENYLKVELVWIDKGTIRTESFHPNDAEANFHPQTIVKLSLISGNILRMAGKALAASDVPSKLPVPVPHG